jgi:hypothetical protein
MPGEIADLLQVANHGIRRKVAHCHIVDHPLAQGRDLAGGQDEVPKGCCVAHEEQQYRKTSS